MLIAKKNPDWTLKASNKKAITDKNGGMENGYGAESDGIDKKKVRKGRRWAF